MPNIPPCWLCLITCCSFLPFQFPFFLSSCKHSPFTHHVASTKLHAAPVRLPVKMLFTPLYKMEMCFYERNAFSLLADENSWKFILLTFYHFIFNLTASAYILKLLRKKHLLLAKFCFGFNSLHHDSLVMNVSYMTGSGMLSMLIFCWFSHACILKYM